MPRIIVQADPPAGREEGPVLLFERVEPVHMESEHYAVQLMERIGWAVADAGTGAGASGSAEVSERTPLP